MIFGFGTAFVSSFNQYIFFRFCVSQAVVGYAISSSALREAGRWGRGAGKAQTVGRGLLVGGRGGRGAGTGVGPARTCWEPTGQLGLWPNLAASGG